MSEFGSRERRLLKLADRGAPATLEARDRVRARVLAQVAAIGATAAVAKSASAGAASSTLAAPTGVLGGASGAAATKLLVVLGTLAALGGGAAWWSTARGRVDRPAAASPTPAQQPPPVAGGAPSAAASDDNAASNAEAPGTVVPVRPSGRETSASAALPPRAAPSRPASDDIDAELGLLRQAHLELNRGNVTLALAALDRHAAEHPRGALTVEREGIRALALCPAQVDPARRWLARHPNLPLASRIRNRCRL